MTGLPLVGRVVLGLRRPRCAVPGRELAGVVEAVGDGVTRFAVGDEVMGVPAPVLKSGAGHGALAELTRAVEDGLVAKPAALSFAEAAAVPISASTALQAVRDHGRVRAGQRVLVIGASGGVGSYAVQLATSYGAEVTAVSGPTKLDLVRELGAVEALDYTRGEPTGVFDVVIDIAGNRPLRQLRELLTPTGTLVIVGGEGGGRWLGGLGRNLWLKLVAPFARAAAGGDARVREPLRPGDAGRARREGCLPAGGRADVPARRVGEGDRTPAGRSRPRQGRRRALTRLLRVLVARAVVRPGRAARVDAQRARRAECGRGRGKDVLRHGHPFPRVDPRPRCGSRTRAPGASPRNQCARQGEQQQ